MDGPDLFFLQTNLDSIIAHYYNHIHTSYSYMHSAHYFNIFYPFTYHINFIFQVSANKKQLCNSCLQSCS